MNLKFINGIGVGTHKTENTQFEGSLIEVEEFKFIE